MALKVAMVGLNGIGHSHAPTHVSDPLAELVKNDPKSIGVRQ